MGLVSQIDAAEAKAIAATSTHAAGGRPVSGRVPPDTHHRHDYRCKADDETWSRSSRAHPGRRDRSDSICVPAWMPFDRHDLAYSLRQADGTPTSQISRQR